MSIHKEIHFENEICTDLAAAGWLYEAEDSARYDRAQALFVDDVVAWIKTNQPKTWETIEKSHGASAPKVVAERLRKALDSQSTLSVLRGGFDMLGLKAPIAMCQFKPALGMNADLQARYAANRLRVVRQVRYSVHHENCIDLVLFLNGIPVATCEIKSHYTQSVQDAIYQYKTDREPVFKPKNVAEPLLAFPGGALVHFALSNTEAAMSTRLAGLDTNFLPFNQGNAGGAGNPPNPAGIATDYLWREVWQRDSFLQILGRYLVPVKNDKKQLVGWIYPRYHQLTVTRKLVGAVKAQGPGGKYLVQHSAGSGKTNSIAWTAHFLADLHDEEDHKVFDTVIVISDRTVLDDQLREALMAFERTQGVVAVVTGEGASKSKELAQALSDGKKIVVCTIQTFPFALEEVRRLSATQGKRFAVIADEAHSSQTNETAAKLKLVLSAAELAEMQDGGDVTAEDILAAQMAAKAGGEDAGITYVAFTATPKDKTLQLFGTRPDPTRPPAADNMPAPFHVYSMRQAIEEGFILDVLKTYTSYKVAFTLAQNGQQMDAKEVDRAEAMKGLMGWVKLHEYNIAQRVQVVVEHYRKHVAGLLGGAAKAMVVTGSRKEAVRWQIATRKYIASHGYKMDALVAFSGEVIDPESGPDPFTENSKDLNPKLGGQGIREAFKSGDYQLLLVANKFQTGFDEPLLCAMYVDKRLGGIQAVQTLSRLNRCYPGKDQTYVVDFVNDPADILAAFKPYYETAELSGVTDPYLVHELKAKLDGQALYDTFEVERVVNVAIKGKKAKTSELDAALLPVANRLLTAYAEANKALQAAGDDTKKAKAAKDEMAALVQFRNDIAAYVRVYGFLAQIFDYGNTDIEKRSIFFRLLHPLLNFGREREGVDLSSLKLTAYTIKSMGDHKLLLSGTEPVKIDPTTEVGTGSPQDKTKAVLDELIAKVNDLFVGELTPGDKLVYVNDVIKGKLMESERLAEQALNNTKEQFDSSPDLDKELEGAIMDALAAHSAMSRQALESAALRADLKAVLLGAGKLWEGLRERASGLLPPP
jgi:type I restriction enzyme R subunit